MSGKRTVAGEAIIAYLDKYPRMATRTLARKITEEHPKLFKSLEHCRKRIGYYRGQSGDRDRKDCKDKSKFTDSGDHRRSPSNVDAVPDANILIFDIETAPNMAYVWGCMKQFISADQLIETSTVLCWAARWLGKKRVMFSRVERAGDDKECVSRLRDLFDQADVVVAHNGRAFDVKAMNTRWLYHKLPPPSPYQVVDTYKLVKAMFRFPRNKLENIARYLDIGKKVEHEGFALWRKIVEENDPSAWKRMKKYNKQDVVLLEQVYMELRAWDKRHPNMSLNYDDVSRCTVCGSAALKGVGTARTSASEFDAFQCEVCGHVMRSRSAIKKTLKADKRMANVQ